MARNRPGLAKLKDEIRFILSQVGAPSLRSRTRFVIAVGRRAALQLACAMVMVSCLNNEAAVALLLPAPSASLTGLFDRH